MALFEHEYPYTNFHEMNLDYMLKKIREMEEKIKDITSDAARQLVEKYINEMLPQAIYSAEDESITFYVELIPDNKEVK